ncbi:MAG: DUF892 family protein [Bdellovibrionales bacterium]
MDKNKDNETQIGMNRTGAQTSPFDTGEMLEDARQLTDEEIRTKTNMDLSAVRKQYFKLAEPVGSVPIPASLTGLVKTAADTIKGLSPEIFIDKLSERLAFERTGVRLYDALITKCEAAKAELPLQTLVRFRAEEHQHFDLLTRVIRDLGADPTAQTPGADVTAVSAMGLIQVVSDPRTTVAHCLQAILTAELADHEGWELLIQLAEQMNQPEAASDFRKALAEEENHLTQIRDLYQEITFWELGGSPSQRH